MIGGRAGVPPERPDAVGDHGCRVALGARESRATRVVVARPTAEARGLGVEAMA
ncbi:hypothetical protein SAMN05444320_101945 [Streptoalloteichus hindustanus]|uniref:Uncharacterized protein n=1 Tax=Streptoalloteichus hindustanus TaxID=2017 RepID=A0A1M4W026_STRHI|nr:hypothetical protein SAMN05444320_101945 [Streptoalloteichus hindustanus]